VGTVEQLPVSDMLVVAMTDSDGGRRSPPAPLCIGGLVGRKRRFFLVSPDLLMDINLV
jgi:hypothetical protein